MHAHREHARIVVEGCLHAIAVMDVDVDVRNSLGTLGEEGADGKDRVVEHAEAAGVAAHRVVQSAGDVDRMLDGAAPDLLGRERRPPGDQRRGLEHSGEDRVVTGAEPEAFEGRINARVLDRIEVTSVVHGKQLCPIGRDRGQHRQPVQNTEGAGQPDGQVEAERVERMVAEVVVEIAVVPDRRSRTSHDPTVVSQHSNAWHGILSVPGYMVTACFDRSTRCEPSACCFAH